MIRLHGGKMDRDPFWHYVFESCINRGVASNIVGEVIDSKLREPKKWVWYNNDCEKNKYALNDIDGATMPITKALIAHMQSDKFVAQLSSITDIEDLSADHTLHGAGVHVVMPGGWLSPHLDYAKHPILEGKERVVNVILFLNGIGFSGDGGAFELYDDMGSKVIKRVYPQAGSMVMWKPGDIEYHGTGRVSDNALTPRYAIAAYYLAPIRPGVTRKRALFVPNRGAK